MEDSEAAVRTEGTRDRENICNVAINSVEMEEEHHNVAELWLGTGTWNMELF